MKAPIAPKKPKKITYHGHTRTDDYFWMKDLKDKDTMKYINAENKFTEATLKPLNKLTGKLFKELKSFVKEDDSTPPAPHGPWSYYTKFKKGQQYALKCRKPRKGGKEQVLIDENKLAKGKKYFSLSTYSISPDHQILAYGTDTKGDEIYTIEFKDLKTGKLLNDKLTQCSGSFAWANDSKTVFYSELNENHQPYKVNRYTLGSKKKPELVYHEKDNKQFIGVSKTTDDAYVLLTSHGKITSEVWFIDADAPSSEPVCVEPRHEGHEYSVEHREGLFYILSNRNALNFKLMVTPVHQHNEKHWQEFIPENPKVLLEDVMLFKNHLVVFEFTDALPRIRVYNFKTEKYSELKFKDPVFHTGSYTNKEYDTKTLRLMYSSPITPMTIYDYDLDTGKRKTIKEDKIKGYKPSLYKCERAWVTGHDGSKIPMTIWHKKGIKKNSKNPAYLYGYGSYGAIIPAAMRKNLISLMNRGFVLATAHIRGGRYMGRAWYEDGKFLNKQNTFKDFISCAEHLIENKWTNSELMSIEGGSAGGMLMGAVTNMRPELFKVCVAHVPFVDVLNTMFDDSLPLTAMEYKEWGNPHDKEYYEYMLSYSPYDNVKKHRYPHMFITGGLHDHRVTYWEPTKWTAKLREYNQGENTILLKIKTAAGHFGASGRFEYLKEIAEAQAFMIKYLGLPLK